MLLVEDKDADGKIQGYYVLGGGTLVDSFYIAKERSPDNEQVKDSEKDGLGDTILFAATTPPEVCLYLCRNHNTFDTCCNVGVNRNAYRRTARALKRGTG